MTRDVVNQGPGWLEMEKRMKNDVWILGASGRTAKLIARQLDRAGVPLVLAGRDRTRLENVAADLGGVPRLVVGSLASQLARLADDAPGVVDNTVGPFTTTGVEVVRACPAGTHYVDIANEVGAFEQVLALEQSVRAGSASATARTSPPQ